MTWPSLIVPKEYAKTTVPFGPPVYCHACSRTGVPEPVLTCLGDFVLRMGGWCTNCRLRCCLLEMTAETVALTPPSKFLVYDQRLPAKGVPYPRVPKSFFDMSEFPFGANAPENPVKTELESDPVVSSEEARAVHREVTTMLEQHGVSGYVAFTLWSKVGYTFGKGMPRTSQIARVKELAAEIGL